MNEPTATPSSDPPSPQRTATTPHRSRWRRRLALLGGLFLLALVVAELVGRFAFGLSHPALFMADPRIEYLYQPDQDIFRYGSHLHVNTWSMRADDFPAHKSDPRELRVMVLGDSVMNGGAKTDQAELATSILQRELRSRLDRPVIVGNASAPSWGPPNMLAYARRFGLFDADIVVIVLNSNDSFDVPTYRPVVGVAPDYPDHRPWFALEEFVTRYLVPRMRYGTGTMQEAPSQDVPASPADVDQALGAVRELIALARSTGARVIVAQHLERAEARGQPKFGHAEIASVASTAGAEVVQLGPAFREALIAGRDPYQPMPNLVHPNALGQRLIAEQLIEPIAHAASFSPTSPPTSLPTSPASSPATSPAMSSATSP